MSKTYYELLEEAAKKNRQPGVIFTIPRGFEEEGLDEEALKKQQIQRQFEKLVLEVELAARD